MALSIGARTPKRSVMLTGRPLIKGVYNVGGKIMKDLKPGDRVRVVHGHLNFKGEVLRVSPDNPDLFEVEPSLKYTGSIGFYGPFRRRQLIPLVKKKRVEVWIEKSSILAGKYAYATVHKPENPTGWILLREVRKK